MNAIIRKEKVEWGCIDTPTKGRSRGDRWKRSILHVNCSRLLAPWDPGVFAHYGGMRRLEELLCPMLGSRKPRDAMLEVEGVCYTTLTPMTTTCPTLEPKELEQATLSPWRFGHLTRGL